MFTVTEFLRQYPDPDAKLRLLLGSHTHSIRHLSPETKMDKQYAQILAQCPWNDRAFGEAYDAFLGTIIAAKTPLSVLSIQLLHRNWRGISVKDFLPYISSILTTCDGPESSVQILHLSFADFVTDRACAEAATRDFALDKAEQSYRMARLCLGVIIQDLTIATPGLGLLAESEGLYEKPGPGAAAAIPTVRVSEVVAYTCWFWIDHVLDVSSSLDDELVADLRAFMATSFVPWLETVVSVGHFQPISRVLSLFMVCKIGLPPPLRL